VSGELSTSTLTYTPLPTDNEKTLHCRATNPEMERGLLEDSWELNVQCKYRKKSGGMLGAPTRIMILGDIHNTLFSS
jgi:hypothetical protein